MQRLPNAISAIGRDKKNPRRTGDFFEACTASYLLDSLNVGSLLALWASSNFERNALVLLQRLEAAGIDCREVREQIFAAFVRSNKTKTLRVIEPLYDTSCHYISYFS